MTSPGSPTSTDLFLSYSYFSPLFFSAIRKPGEPGVDRAGAASSKMQISSLEICSLVRVKVSRRAAERANSSHMTPLLSERQITELLGVSKSTLERARKRGEAPPSIRVGARRRYDREAVQAWLQERAR